MKPGQLTFTPFKEGGTMGKPYAVQYFITQTRGGKFFCHWSEEIFDTVEEAQSEAQIHYRNSIR